MRSNPCKILQRLLTVSQLVILVLAFYVTERLTRKATDGFAVLKMALSTEDEEEAPPYELLNQRFSYLGKGGQCYVFASEDGNYVLKFFRRHRGLQHTYQSVRLAYQRLQKETGLSYIHLGKNKQSLPLLQIVDKLRIAHTIDPNAYSWVLQKRAEPIRAHLTFLMEEGKLEEAKQALSALIALHMHISQRGIADGDANLSKNFGFLKDQPIEIDIGRFEIGARDDSKFRQSKEDLQHWLNAHYPLLSVYLEEEFQRYQNSPSS